jgi:hypothetical protein
LKNVTKPDCLVVSAHNPAWAQGCSGFAMLGAVAAGLLYGAFILLVARYLRIESA